MRESSPDESSLPPPKRRRFGGSLASYGSTAFWFSDGDIVLEVEQHRFKVHGTRLQCSEIFLDMLGMPQPKDADAVDGCPLVLLADSAQDWQVALKWMYDPDSFAAMQHPVPFPLLPSALRIGTKYEIAALREWAVNHLCARWPSDLERMDTTSLPCAAEAIALARECDVPEILSAAFYALSLQRFGCNADGGRSHVVLSQADMRRLVIGRERLTDFATQLLLDPLSAAPGMPPFESCDNCRDTLQRYWRAKVASDPQSPFERWLLREFYLMLTVPDALFESGLCVGCLTWHKDAAWTRFDSLKTSMSRLFCL
ncbi:uncharacterized protein B0H18DRAFT_1027278 [Fomitopsis serialis]|uniref:uncharacterized protein n=1 Tax=Fomitopsis serialis TaxID=139415 RepID=UPI0020078230|nr:uncharacterized protein B0H18DRAFT_1027278 [Neoantrodia serialis]KAH9919636.1 hypothetical protein B0H18DRAFT_1027278 [Neoantrodia serialis]